MSQSTLLDRKAARRQERHAVTESSEKQPLVDEAQTILDEARMVLPGVQALFGFQMVAVFNARFAAIDAALQALHFAALVLCALAMALVMTPAAYHRLAERGRISRHFTEFASRLVALGMAPLALSLALDVTVVAHVLFDLVALSLIAGGSIIAIFAGLWFLWPIWSRREQSKQSI